QLTGYAQTRRREIDDALLADEFRADATADGDTLQSFQEIDMEKGAAELAVGDAFEANCFLFLDDLTDILIFDTAQFLFGNFLVEILFAGFQQRLWPEQTAHMVSAERGIEFTHEFLSPNL